MGVRWLRRQSPDAPYLDARRLSRDRRRQHQPDAALRAVLQPRRARAAVQALRPAGVARLRAVPRRRACAHAERRDGDGARADAAVGSRLCVRVLPRQLRSGRARGPAAHEHGWPRDPREPAARRARGGVAHAAAGHAPDARLERLRRRAVEALMAAALITVLSLTVLGVPFVLALDRDAPPLRLLGLAILYGTGAVYFVLLALSVLLVRLTLLDVAVAVLLMSAAMPPLSWRRHGRRTPLHLVDLCALLTPIAFSIYATMVAVWEWDFWSIWGLKARVIFARGGIHWRFLESRWNLFVHPDYPLLVPFAYDFAALVNGGWSDRWLWVLFVAR